MQEKALVALTYLNSADMLGTGAGRAGAPGEHGGRLSVAQGGEGGGEEGDEEGGEEGGGDGGECLVHNLPQVVREIIRRCARVVFRAGFIGGDTDSYTEVVDP